MRNPSREAWDALTEADFIHSCDCIVCKSLRDDSGRSCSGCAVHHVANKALRARIALLEKVVEENKRLREAVEVADRWRKRKGHNDDHDCDLCNAIRKAKEE